MPRKGFSISFSSHDGRKFRNFDIYGRKLIVFRIISMLTSLVLLVVVILTTLFFVYNTENKELSRENRIMSDSLASMVLIERRVDELSEELREIIEARVIIENMTQIIEPQDE